LTDTQKNFIRRKVAANGRHLVWIMAPGYMDGSRSNSDWIGDVTGMTIVRHALDGPPQATLQTGGRDCRLQLQKPFSPFFVVKDKATTSLGVLEGSNQVVFARRDLGSHTSWFCSLPPTDDELLGHIFREAGAHIYLPPGDVIHAGGGIVCIHTAQGGERELVMRNGRRLRLQLQPRSTSLYDAETGEALLV
jgi:hypothetical protein